MRATSSRGSSLVFALVVFLVTTVLVLGGALWLRSRRGSVPPAMPEVAVEEGLLEGPAGPEEPARSLGGTAPSAEANPLAQRVEATRPREVLPDFERTAFEQRMIAVYREARHSVVHVTSHWMLRNQGGARANLQAGSGSGFVWDENGYVVTSYGTVQGVDGAFVRLFDGSTWQARFVGDAREYDIALLYIEAPRALLRPVALGGSRDLEVGQSVLALGNPSGEEVLLLTGVIAGREQTLGSSASGRILRSVVLTDIPLGAGMAGGPLFDSGGRLVGLRASVAAGTHTSVAIPVELVNRVVPRIVREGHVPWPELGLLLAPESTASHLGVEGVVILEAIEDGPAARAGIHSMVATRPGNPTSYDLLVGIDERPVHTRSDVDEALLEHQPGEVVVLDVQRDGQTLRFFVPLE